MRINKLFSLINDYKNLIIDVGSDHAFLSKLIIDNNKSKRVINLEKNDGPLLNSVNNTKENKYITRIYNIKSDGLNEIDSSLFIDICFISGMGGNTIIDILENAKKNKISEYILQPNNNEYQIRKWAKKNNWKIKNELIIKDNNLFYEIIILNKKQGYKPIFKKDIFFGKINLKNKDKYFIEKYNVFFENKKSYLDKNKNLSKKYKIFKKVIKNDSE